MPPTFILSQDQTLQFGSCINYCLVHRRFVESRLLMKLALHQKDRSYEPMKNLNSRNTSKTHPNRNRGESYSASASTVLCWQTQELKFLNSKIFKEVTYRIVKEQVLSAPTAAREHVPANYGILAHIHPSQPQGSPAGLGEIRNSTRELPAVNGFSENLERAPPVFCGPEAVCSANSAHFAPQPPSLRTRAGQAREITAGSTLSGGA